MSWTSEEIDSKEGKVAVVTGVNSGLGFETARKLAEKGALPTLYGTTENLEGGEFKQLRGNPTKVEPDPRAENPDFRKKIWTHSEKQLGIKYEI